MTDEEVREILQKVARGELDADEAARLLDAEDTATEPLYDEPTQRWSGAGDDYDDGEPIAATAPAGDSTDAPARALRVSTTARKLRIVGDPTVHEVLVRGAQIRRDDGGLLVVEAEPEEWTGDEPWARGFAMLGAGPWSWEWERHAGRGRDRAERVRRKGYWGAGVNMQPIDIRANPDVALTIDSTAGAVRISGMHGAITASLTAGSAVVADVRGPLDCSVTAGSIAVSGPIAVGDSKIGCDMGSVKVRLERGADVRVKVDSTMGKADVWLAAAAGHGDRGEWVVGNGTASLAITANMGSVKVREEA
jgi:hypothetical protein